MQPKPPSTSLKPLLISMALCILIGVFVRAQLDSVTPLSVDAPLNVFSSERAFNMLERLTKEQVPHPVDSAANRLVEQRLVSILRDMGYQEQIQDTQVCRDFEFGAARCTRVRNVIVNIEGSEKGNGILLAAHYDSVPAGPGGSDAGAAVGALLETARLLKLEGKRPRNSIVFLFNEGEEFGLFGARAFMEQHPLAKSLKLAINVEARGSSGQSVMFETGEDSGWLVKHYSQTTKAPLSSSLFYEVYKYLPNDTDLTVFKEHGLQGLNFAHAERLAHYHTPLDNLENLDRGSLQHHGDNVWGVLNNIKDLDLGTVESGNLVYTDIMGLFVIQWQEQTSLLVSIVLILVVVLLIILARKQQLIRIKRVFKGVAISLAILIAVTVVALLVKVLIQMLSGSDYPWYSNKLPMQLSVWSSVALIGLMLGKFLLGNSKSIESLWAVTIIWLLLSATTSALMPGVSFLFIVPAATSVLAVLAMTWMARVDLPNSTKTACQALVLIVVVCIVAIIFMPIAYTLEIMLGYGMAPAIGLVLGFVVLSLLPVLNIDPSQNRGFKQLMVGTALFLIMSVGWTSSQTVFTTLMPQHLNLIYLQNDQAKAFILKGHENNQLPEALANGTSNQTKLQAIFPWSPWKFHTSPIASAVIAPASVSVLKSSVDRGLKTVVLAVSADAEKLRDVIIYIPTDSGLESIEAAKKLVYKGEKSRLKDYYQYHCRGVSCSETRLAINFHEDKPTKILVASVYEGLPNALSGLIQLRGNTAVPVSNGDRSIVYSELEIK